MYHILNGDCLHEQLQSADLEGDCIICRECLVVGEISADSLADFWVQRANFIGSSYRIDVEEYYERTKSEFDKMLNLPDGSEICLWFEDDLFCQVNLWFVIFLLAQNPSYQLFRVFPTFSDPPQIWKGFGISTAGMLEKSYKHRVSLSPQDIDLGVHLWNAFKNNDLSLLLQLAGNKSSCFRYLKEVCQAHIDRSSTDQTLGRPERKLKEILNTGLTDFDEIMQRFQEEEGIYGFGDFQIQSLHKGI